MRRIGLLMPFAAEDRQAKLRLAAFLQGLQQFGWNDGRNVQMETRWGVNDSEILQKCVAELLALAPDVDFRRRQRVHGSAGANG